MSEPAGSSARSSEVERTPRFEPDGYWHMRMRKTPVSAALRATETGVTAAVLLTGRQDNVKDAVSGVVRSFEPTYTV